MRNSVAVGCSQVLRCSARALIASRTSCAWSSRGVFLSSVSTREPSLWTSSACSGHRVLMEALKVTSAWSNATPSLLSGPRACSSFPNVEKSIQLAPSASSPKARAVMSSASSRCCFSVTCVRARSCLRVIHTASAVTTPPMTPPASPSSPYSHHHAASSKRPQFMRVTVPAIAGPARPFSPTQETR